MFFSIAPTPQDNFSYFYQLGPFAVSTDAGWHVLQVNQYSCVYKGYVDTDTIISAMDQIIHQSEPKLLGNFCVLAYNLHTGTLEIKTDRYRSFPIYFQDGHEVTNLKHLSQTAWTDSLIKIQQDFQIQESKFDLIGQFDTDPITADEIVEEIHYRLSEKTKNFIAFNSLSIRTFLSGGVDSLLVYSYLQRFTKDFELVKCNIIEYDKFWLQNSGFLSEFWAYSQIHHWIEPCVLTSGAPGDEFMLRSPVTADLFLKYHNLQITDLLTQKNWLHNDYFNKKKHIDLFQQQNADKTLSQEQFYWQLCNAILNDWQHWHLGNTLTWTPLRDLEIFKLMLRLPISTAIAQIMDSELSRQLIEKNSVGLTRLISDQKNSGNIMKNLADWLLQAT
jgi:hypothetical protein